ncbi:MAG: hypothetical protein J1E80_01900 [Desulfovibrionaceae bacterium]|nr:hypothetical protein [Desulfovibrionaceae bacterium]
MPLTMNQLAHLFSHKPDGDAGQAREQFLARIQAVVQTLQLAREARVDLYMDFFQQGQLTLQLKGPCVEAGAEGIRIYLRGDTEKVPDEGMDVHVYFFLRVDRQREPFDFLARVLSVERELGQCFLLLSLPETLGHSQRRKNVRVSVSEKDIGDFHVWYCNAEAPAEGSGKTLLPWKPVSFEEAHLLDMSAGGLKLQLKASSVFYDSLSPRSLVLARGTFDLEEAGPQQLNMIGSVVRVITMDENKKLASLGVAFKRWAHPEDGHLVWRQLSPEHGVNPLGTWVVQVLLDRRRNELKQAKTHPGAPGEKG